MSNANTPNILIPLSVFEGGHLFIEDDDGIYELDAGGPRGNVHPVTLPFLSFNASKRHLVLPLWSRRRLILGAYHVRDADRLPHHSRQSVSDIPKPGKPADKPSQLRPLGILRPDAKGLAGTAKESRSSWSRSLCPTCGLCPSSLISQDAAFLMRRVGSYSIYGKFGNSVARRAPVGSSCSGDMVQPIW